MYQNQTKTGGKTIEEVYKLRQNVIYDDGTHYVLEHIFSGKRCYFDHTDRALQTVERAIERDGSFTPSNGRKSLHVQPNKGSKYYISQLLYGVYHGKPLSWVRDGRVNFNDGNSENLTSTNISHTHADEADNINRKIWCAGDYIFLYHKKSGQCYFCDYDPELYKLLCHHRIIWGYQPDLGRLQATVLRKKRKMQGFAFGFHSLVYAFHHYGARYRNFIGAIRRMQADFQKRGLCIDHFDSNQVNNTLWNLSVMTKAQNSQKCNLTDRIRHPFFLLGAHHNGKYKLLCGRVYETEAGLLDPAFDAAFVLCKDADSLNDFLKALQDTKWEDGLSPAKNLKDNPDAICFQDYFGDFGATQIRKLLMEREEQDFTVWQKEKEEDV